MDDPFIYILLFSVFLIFILFDSAFGSISQLKLELDKKNVIYNSKIISFIRKRYFEFQLSLKIYYVLSLILLIILLIDGLNNYTNLNILNTFLFIFIFSIIVLPGLIVIPLTLSEYFSNKIINISAPILVILFILASPITYTLILLSNAPLKLFLKDKLQSEIKSNFSKDDLNELVRENELHTLQSENKITEIKLFKNALDFSEIKLRDCMIPRTEIEAIEIGDIEEELKQKFIDTGYSKIIIYRDTIDEIVGYIKSKELLDNTRHQIKNIPIYPETMQANKLLRHFIRTGQNIAVIVDEFGGTSGIITIEDILEEIFGEIEDEHDTDELIEKKLTENDFVFSGRLEIDYLNEKYELNIQKSEEYETIAGFILYHTEKLPQINDIITIDNFQFKVLRVINTKVELLKLEILD